jgi:hypothetical protein
VIPLAVWLVLGFVAGIMFAPAVLAGQIQVEQCSDNDALPEVPVDKGD